MLIQSHRLQRITLGAAVLCVALGAVAPAAAQTTPDFFLHGSGGTANPPTLFLDINASTATTAKYKDSPSINFSGGNPWQPVGTWATSPVPAPGILTALQPIHVWLGLKNSDDQGTNFDLLAELYKNGALITSGLTRCITGVTSNASQAKEVTATFGSFSSESLNGTTDTLSLKIWTRIGTNPDNTKCTGHSNAVGLRVYFDATSRSARFGATIGSPNPVPTTLTPNPLTITVGATGMLTATLSPAPPAAGTLSASSDTPSVATVPASISFGANQSSVPVPVTAVGVGNAQITVSLNGGSAIATVQVTPQPPTVTSLQPPSLTITQGGSGTLTVAISAAQTTNTTVVLSSTAPGIASVPASVTVLAGQTTAPITVSANTPGTAQIAASLNGTSATSTITVTPALPTVVSLLPPTNPVTIGATTTLMVTISAAQPMATVVNVSATPNGIVTVPSTVTVPANQTSAPVTVGTVALGTAMVTASLNGSSASSTVTVSPPAPALVSLTQSPLTVVVNATGTLTVTLNAAQLTNTDVALSVDNGSVLQVPASVTVQAGFIQASFTVTGQAVGDAIVTATLGTSTQSATVHVIPPPPTAVSLLPNPLMIQQGATGMFTLTINAAQLADTVIPLTNSAPAVLQAPGSVTVPAGQTSVTFPVTALTPGSATVTASINGTSASATVNVTPPPTVVTGLTPATQTVPKGTPAVLHVAVSPASTQPQTVSLTSGNTSVATVPATVPVPAGALGADFPVMTVGVGTATITASLNGGTASATVVVTPAELVTLTLSPQTPTVFVGQTEPFTATGTFTDGTTQNLTTSVTWTSSNQAVATINASGVASALAAGTTTIKAASGSITAETTLTVLTPPALSLAPATATLRQGDSVMMTVTSATPADIGGLTVTLTRSGTGSVTAPATVVIPEGQSSATFTVTGATVGSVTLTVSAPIRTPASSTLTILSAAPTISGFTPTSGKAGDQVTITGTNFVSVTAVAFNGVPATSFTVNSQTSIVAVVPTNATTGPITVTNPFGTGISAGSFVVTPTQDFQLSALPAGAGIPAVGSAAFSIGLTGSGGFTNLTTLAVAGVPTGATSAFSAATLTAGQSTLLTVTTTGATPAGSYPLTVTATGLVNGAQAVRTATVTMQVLGASVTTLSGQVLDENAQPVVGAVVKLGPLNAPTTQTVTDNGGNFLLQNVPAGANLMLFIDGGPASTPDKSFPIVPYKVMIVAGQNNTLGFTPYLHFQKTTGLVDISNSSVQRTVTDTTIPGYQMTIPSGVTITGWDGQPNTQISIRRVPIDRSPLPPLPSDRYAASGYMDYFNKPGGGTPSAPIPITFPNDLDVPPGTQVELWFYDEAPDGSRPNQMAQYGTGTVSADGSQIVPNIDPATGKPYGQPRFCCGWVEPAINRATRAIINANRGGDPPTSPDHCPCGDPVDPSTGVFTYQKTDLTLAGRLPVTFTRYYRTLGAATGPFGPGTSHSYQAFLMSESSLRTLVLPNGNRIAFPMQSNGTFQNFTDPAYRGAVITATGNGTHTLRFKDGTTWGFNAPFSGTVTGFLVSQTDRNGNTVTITRDGLQNLTAITDSVGRQFTVTLNGANQISQITDPIGRIVYYTYDGSGYLIQVFDPQSQVTTFNYDGSGNMVKIVDPRGNTYVTNQYDSNNRVIKQTRADGGTFTFAYTVTSGVVTQTVVTDPQGNATTYRFNGKGYSLGQTDPQGQASLSTLDPATNQLLASVDSLGRKTSYTYDDAGNTTSITDPASNVTRFEYEPTFNRVTKITDALNNVTTFTYDAHGNLLTTTDPLNHTKTMTYNTFGQLLTAQDPLNNVTTFTYDTTGNLLTATDPLGNQTQRVYDNVSRLIVFLDPRNTTTNFNYDSLNRVVQIADALNGLTGFGYDPNGNLLSVADAKNQTTIYTYDVVDRLSTRKDALGRQESYQYDTDGNTTQFIDRKSQAASFTYDSRDRRIGASYADGSSTSLTYDSVGRLATVTDSVSGTIQYTYDNLNRLVQEITPQGSIVYQYDVLGRRSSMTVNGQQPVTYQYDAASRLIQVAQGSLVVTIGYDAAGRRTSLTYPNGTSTSYTYDNASRLTNIMHNGPSGVIESVTYTYDAAGNRLTANRASGTATAIPNATTASYDAANEQTQFGATTLTYDANGNLTNDGTNTYTWDARNRLSGINGVGSSSGFNYDATGRRMTKVINGVVTQHLYSGSDVVAEINSGAITASYLRGLNFDDPFIRQTSTNGYYHTDSLGSTLALTGDNGTVSVAYSYEPFGKTNALGVSANPFQYTGRENDGTGLYYYRARYYSPLLQRFLSEDPLGFKGGDRNLYGYVFNNPANSIDPSGLAQICCRPAFKNPFGDRSILPGNPQHCWVVDDFGGTHSFIAPWTSGISKYSQDYPDDRNSTTQNCKPCQPTGCSDSKKQLACIQKAANEISGYAWAGENVNSNTGIGWIASKCCKGGFPKGLGNTPGADAIP